ncbi:MAG: DNA adenine methylase [Candidatus Thorarchaeota archaeon]
MEYYNTRSTMQDSGSRTGLIRDSHPRITLRNFDKVSNPKSIHGLYPYRGKMSPLDAAHVVSQLPSSATLLDPFCGTGTIVYEAQAHGMRAIGVDNNPLACTIARGKTESYDTSSMFDDLESAIFDASNLENFPEMPASPAKFFHPETADQIMRMIKLSTNFSSYLLSALYGAICVAARACNGWLWTSTSIGRINEPLRRIDFYSTFRRKARKHVEFLNDGPSAIIHTHDARKIHDIIEEDSVDIVYTSPPYFDALDYTSYYSKIVFEILGIDRAGVRKGLIQRYSTYRKDMKEALAAIDRVVHDNSLIIFVVGDRRVRGELIRGSDFFKEIAPWDYCYVAEREYTNTASGIWDEINKTKRKEQMIVWDLGNGGPV